jgi:hypothetical protein
LDESLTELRTAEDELKAENACLNSYRRLIIISFLLFFVSSESELNQMSIRSSTNGFLCSVVMGARHIGHST